MSVSDLLVLSRIPGIGANRLRSLVTHFGDSTSVLTASAKEISHIEGFSRKLAAGVVHFCKDSSLRSAREYAERQLSKLNALDGRVVSYWDPSYPELLKRIYDPPAYFYLKGTLHHDDRYSIGVVGTRFPTEYGTTITEQFSGELAKLGLTIVSGLARGIDTVSHGSALKHGGRTVAVIGSGLDVMYPSENKPLSERIARSGGVISEYEMGAKPDAVNFPRRNRIISGMTLGTVVIETDLNGGAMITANLALDQNREVFAVPGNINGKRSRGCNALIREGKAKLVQSVDDILVELSSALPQSLRQTFRRETTPAPELTFFEKAIYDHLSDTPKQIDTLAAELSSPTSDILVNLLSMEFKGLVKQLAGKMFLRC